MRQSTSLQHCSPWTDTFARAVTTFAGSTAAFVIAVAVVLAWLVSGPFFHYSDTWQLVINTGTTIVTFLMVFLIQRFQNRDSLALQLKLNELVCAIKGASNRLIDVEDLSGEELDRIESYYRQLAGIAKRERALHKTHSLDQVMSENNSHNRRVARGRSKAAAKHRPATKAASR